MLEIRNLIYDLHYDYDLRSFSLKDLNAPSHQAISFSMNGDDYAGDQTTTGVVNLGGQTTGVLETTSDSDWFAVTLSQGQTLNYQYEDMGEGPSFILRDASGAIVSGILSQQGGFETAISFTAAATGTYYIDVSGANEEDYIYSFDSYIYIDDFSGDASTTGVLTAGASVTGTLQGATDIDWFSISADAGNVLKISTTGLSDIDNVLQLHDGTGAVIASQSFDINNPGEPFLEFQANSTGTYYVSVAYNVFDILPSSGSYTLSLALDDYAGDSSTLGILTDGGQANGTVEENGDSDWFSVELTNGETLEVSLLTATLADVDLLIRDAGGFVQSISRSDIGTSSYFQFTALSSETFYVSVTGQLGGATPLAYGLGAEIYNDDYGASTTSSGAIMADGGSVTGVLQAASDHDWFALTLVAGEQLTITSSGLDGAIQNMALRGANGENVFAAFNAASATLTFTAETSGTYYLDVFNTSANSEVAYTLNSDVVVAPVILNLDGDVATFSEGGGAVYLDVSGAENYQGVASLAASVSDANSTGYDGGRLTVSILSGGVTGEDLLGVGSSAVSLSSTLAGGTLSVSGVIVGTLARDILTDGSLEIDFNAAATDASIAAIIGALTYNNVSQGGISGSARTLAVTLSDAEGDISQTSSVRVDMLSASSGIVVGEEGTRAQLGDLAIADVNNDGFMDVIYNYVETGQQVWLNDGAGNFTYDETLRLDGMSDIRADLDGDGDDDLLTAAGVISLNRGTSGFEETGQAFTSPESQTFAFGDLDGDGDLDLIQGQNVGPNTVWLNDGNGVFTNTGQALGMRFTRDVSLGDIDGDGDLDLVTANAGGQGVYVWENDGNGNFTDTNQMLRAAGSQQSEAVELADMDGDGDLDIIVANNISHSNRIYLNDGDGTFSYTGLAFGTGESRHLEVFDFDYDGDLDVIFGNGFRTPSTYWLNDGLGNLTQQGPQNTSSYEVALGDLDGDGDLDAVYANWSEFFGEFSRGNTIELNNGDGSFTATGQYLGNTGTRSISLADIDADGDLDILSANFSSGNEIWLNDGSGTFTDSGQRLGDGRSFGSTVGDIDGDGDLDWVVANRGTAATEIWLNDGRGQFNTSANTIAVDDVNGVQFADFDGDRDLDIYLSADSERSIWINDGSGAFIRSAQVLTGSEFEDEASVADLNSDGHLDLVDGNIIRFNDGTGVFTAGQTIAGIAGFGDIDGDGDIDIAQSVKNASLSYSYIVWLNDGSGTFTETSVRFGISDSQDVEFADLNGDGELDAIVANWGQPNAVFLSGINTAPVFQSERVLYLDEYESLFLLEPASDIDAGQRLTYTISGGADSGLFSLGQSNTDTYLSFSAPGFGDQLSAAGTSDYQVELTVSDGLGGQATAMFTVVVNDVTAETQTGTALDETLFGTIGMDVLIGLGGDDDLRGDDGSDTLDGGDGDDLLLGNHDDDLLIGGAGNDDLNGGGGFDTASYADDTAGVIFNLDTATRDGVASRRALDGSGSTDTLTFIENAIGSAFDDSLWGNFLRNTLEGGGGNDSLYGRGGNDRLIGGAGDDLLNGASGVDIADYSGASSAVDVDLTAGMADDGDGGMDTLVSIESVIGSAFDDMFVGSSINDTFSGGSGADDAMGGLGNDTLRGGDGIDLLNGEDGSDRLYGDSGNDTINGGAGVDVIDGGLGADIINGGADGDRIYGRDGNDTINGGSGIDIINAQEGDDILNGGGDRDFLRGNDGDDTISGDGGDDRIDGGADTDTVVYAGNQADYNIILRANGVLSVEDLNLANGDEGFDIITNAEFLQFADGVIDIAGL